MFIGWYCACKRAIRQDLEGYERITLFVAVFCLIAMLSFILTRNLSRKPYTAPASQPQHPSPPHLELG